MELYITGDTHGDFSRFRPESFYEQERLTKEDVILSRGLRRRVVRRQPG